MAAIGGSLVSSIPQTLPLGLLRLKPVKLVVAPPEDRIMARTRKLRTPASESQSTSRRTRTLAPPASTAMAKVKAKPRARRVTQLVAPTELQVQLITKKMQSYGLIASAKELERLAVGVPTKKRRSPKEEDTSDSSSGEAAVEEAGRTKILAAGTKKKIEKYLDYLMEEVSVGLSVLERTAVMKAVDKTYLAAAGTMLRHLAARGINVDVDADETIDRGIVDYMNELWLKGVKAHSGNYLLAGLLHLKPEFGRLGARKLPRAWRALKGWRRLTPGKSRKAHALAVWAGVCYVMVTRGRRRMAIFVLMIVSTYARPSSLLAAGKEHLVPPVSNVNQQWSLLLHPEELESPSKTGEYDLSLVLDSPWMSSWIDSTCRALKSTDGSRLWDFDYSEIAAELRTVGKLLGVHLTLYMGRHSGPSIDRALKLRDISEVKKRGHWKSWKSVARYEKSARLASSFNNLSDDQQLFFQQCEAQLGAFMSGLAVDISLPAVEKAGT